MIILTDTCVLYGLVPSGSWNKTLGDCRDFLGEVGVNLTDGTGGAEQ